MEPQPKRSDIPQNGQASAGARPYRSHKIRACDLCRRRKVKCIIDRIGQSCHLCQNQGSRCSSSTSNDDSPAVQMTMAAHNPVRTKPNNGTTSVSMSPASVTTPHRRPPASLPPPRPFEPDRRQASDHGRESASTAPVSPVNVGIRASVPIETTSSSTHIIGPVAAEDAQVLEEFMSPDASNRPESAIYNYNRYSTNPQKPVLYTTISRRRQGILLTSKPGKSQREIFEQIVAPNALELVKLYFEKINPSFPVIDYDSFMLSYGKGDIQLSSNLVCEIYAVTVIFWKQSYILEHFPCPDVIFGWNLAVKALQDDFLAPALSTVQAALLDLTGRPVLSITGNGVNNGRTVALSNSLGLNRDPRDWQIPVSQKNLRIRLWWSVLIHDHWASLAHGTPPHIASNQYDVRLPDLSTLDAAANDRYTNEKEAFIALCRLTEVLGSLLPLVYYLRVIPIKDTSKRIRPVETSLDEWEDSLPAPLSKIPPISGIPISGSCSLWLGFLIIKMLICRIKLHAITHSPAIDNTSREYHQGECRRAAEAVVYFMVSLQKQHLEEFWLPYTAYHLTSTATLLLRCALETEDDSIAESCISTVRTLTEWLRRAKEEHEWDLGEFCIVQCETVLNRMTTNSDGNGTRALSLAAPTISDTNYFSDQFNYSFPMSNMENFGAYEELTPQIPDLWDMFRFEEADFSSTTMRP